MQAAVSQTCGGKNGGLMEAHCIRQNFRYSDGACVDRGEETVERSQVDELICQVGTQTMGYTNQSNGLQHAVCSAVRVRRCPCGSRCRSHRERLRARDQSRVSVEMIQQMKPEEEYIEASIYYCWGRRTSSGWRWQTSALTVLGAFFLPGPHRGCDANRKYDLPIFFADVS